MYQYIPDLNNDGFAGLSAYVQAKFKAATGCDAIIDYGYNVDTYTYTSAQAALQPCPPPTPSNPNPVDCGYDMMEIDTLVLGRLVNTPHLLQPMPASVQATISDFFPQARSMVKLNGIQWAQPSYSCDNIFLTYERGLEDVTSQTELVEWIQDKIGNNRSRIGWTTDMNNVWDMGTIYVDAHLDSFPKQPLCCADETAYSPVITPSVGNALAQLVATCADQSDSTHNDCLSGILYSNQNYWFEQLITGKSVLLQGFSTYISNIIQLGGSLDGMTITTATLGTGSQPYLFTDAFVLSKSNCPDDGCVDAAALFMNWQRLEGQIGINLGKDLNPPTPRYLLSSNENFYTDPRTSPYLDVYDIFWNEEGTGDLNVARALDTQHYTNHYCDQYAALQAYIPTGSSCADQGYPETPQ